MKKLLLYIAISLLSLEGFAQNCECTILSFNEVSKIVNAASLSDKFDLLENNCFEAVDTKDDCTVFTKCKETITDNGTPLSLDMFTIKAYTEGKVNYLTYKSDAYHEILDKVKAEGEFIASLQGVDFYSLSGIRYGFITQPYHADSDIIIYAITITRED